MDNFEKENRYYELNQERADELEDAIREELLVYDRECPEHEVTIEDVLTAVIKCVHGTCSEYQARRLAQAIDDLYK